MEIVHQLFCELFKLEVVAQVNHGILSKEEARRRYGIRDKSAILLWQRNYKKYGRCSVTLLTNNALPFMAKKPSQIGTTEKDPSLD